MSSSPTSSSNSSRPVPQVPRATTVGVTAETTCAPGLKLVLETLDLSESVRFSDAYGRWLRLISHDSGATIDQHPECVLRDLPNGVDADEMPPVALFANPSESARESLAAGILVPSEVRLNSLGGLGFPWKLRGYRLVGDSLLGWRSIESQRFVLNAVIDWAKQHTADFLLVKDVDQRSSLWSLLKACGDDDFVWLPSSRTQTRWRVRFPVPPGDLWKKFSPKAYNSLRQKAKSIGRSRLVRVTESDQVPGFLEYAQTVSQHAVPGRQRRASVSTDRRELQSCLLLAEQHWLRSYVWIIDGTPAGIVIGYQNRSGFRIRKIVCDQRFERHSGEAIMLFRVLEDLIKHDTPQFVDFGNGDAQFKRLFANESSRTTDVLLIRRSRWLNVGLAYLRTCRMIRVVIGTVLAGLRDCDPLRLLHLDAGSGATSDDA